MIPSFPSFASVRNQTKRSQLIAERICLSFTEETKDTNSDSFQSGPDSVYSVSSVVDPLEIFSSKQHFCLQRYGIWTRPNETVAPPGKAENAFPTTSRPHSDALSSRRSLNEFWTTVVEVRTILRSRMDALKVLFFSGHRLWMSLNFLGGRP